jgi:hypothetical protein
MKVINVTSGPIQITNFFPERNLDLEPNVESRSFVPTKDRIRRLMKLEGKVKVKVESVTELDLIGQTHPDAMNLIKED